MPDRADRLRRRQEAAGRDHGGEIAGHSRAAGGDRPRPVGRVECPSRGQPLRARTRSRDAGAGPQGDEDRFPGAAMIEEDLDESAYKVTLPSFHGPLDLLLHLIKQNEIDIYDIPIARITDQYNSYL